jgi:hypothetical protein
MLTTADKASPDLDPSKQGRHGSGGPLQLTPDALYNVTLKVSDLGDEPFGQVYVDSRQENWSVGQFGVDNIATAERIQFVGTVQTGTPAGWPPSGNLPVFTMGAVGERWHLGGPGLTTRVFMYAPSSAAHFVAYQWMLTYEKGVWSGKHRWYYTSSATPSADTHLLGLGTYQLTAQTGSTTAPSGQSWYFMDHTPGS